ncbi:MAG: hypothetical protein SFX73_15355 [Kofleriaceae bacterium]|nr:hypothetical protein [Kofleriaceae bacterium]
MVTAQSTRPWRALSFLALALALALGACLDKPSAPAGTTDAAPMFDMPADADLVDASFCPPGATPLPADLLLRRISRIGNYDNDTNDDVFVWGRTQSGQGTSAAYLVRGREPMELRCYDRAFAFTGNAVEILDTWFGDLTRDSSSDLLLFARDDGPNNAYLTHLYPGLPAGGVAGTPDERAGSKNTFSSPIGSSLFDPYPAYIAGWTSTEEAGVVFGGINAPYGALVFDSGLNTIQAPMVMQDMATGNGMFFSSEAVQDMIPYNNTDPHRFLVVTNANVDIMAHVAGTPATFEKLGGRTALSDNLPRFVRAWRHLYGNSELVAATQASGGFDIITYDGTAPRVRRLQAGSELDGRTHEDIAFGNLDGDTSLDLVALVSNNSAAQLIVYRNLVFGTDTITATAPRSITLPKSHNILAVGDFDGNASTPDTILALQTGVNGSLGRCLHFVVANACLAECSATCP